MVDFCVRFLRGAPTPRTTRNVVSFLFGTGFRYNSETAAVLSRLSYLVYGIKGWNEDENKGKIHDKKTLAEECKKWIADDKLQADFVPSDKDDPTSDNAALVVVTSATIYLVFRGTVPTSRINWIQNCTCTRHQLPISSGEHDRYDQGGKVHKGFYLAQKSLWGKLIDDENLFARSLFGPESNAPWRGNLYIGGHSLGGAMAIITAARLASEQNVKRIDGVYTFGSPDLFDHYAIRQYSEHPVLIGKTFRVENDGDIVTNILASCCGFLHPGTSIRIRERDGRTVPGRCRDDACCVPRCRTCCSVFTCMKAHRVGKSYMPTAFSMAYEVDPVGTLESRTAQLEKRRAIRQLESQSTQLDEIERVQARIDVPEALATPGPMINGVESSEEIESRDMFDLEEQKKGSEPVQVRESIRQKLGMIRPPRREFDPKPEMYNYRGRGERTRRYGIVDHE